MDDPQGADGTVWAATARSAADEVERTARLAVQAAVHRRGLAVIVLDDVDEVRRCCRAWTAATFAGAWPYIHLFLASDRPTASAPAGQAAAFVEAQLLPGWPLPRGHWHPMPLVPASSDAPARLERAIRMVCELPPPACPRFDLLVSAVARMDAWPASAADLVQRIAAPQADGLAMTASLLRASRRVVLFDEATDAAEIRWDDRRRLFGSSESIVRVLVRPTEGAHGS